MVLAARQYRFFAGYADKLWGRADSTRPARRVRLRDTRAARSRRAHHRVEFADGPAREQARPGAGGRQLRRDQALRACLGDHAGILPVRRGGRVSAGRRQCRLRRGRGRACPGRGRRGQESASREALPSAARSRPRPAAVSCRSRWSSAASRPTSFSRTRTWSVPRSGALAGIFGATGQTCVAGSRLLVQRSVHDRIVRTLARARSRDPSRRSAGPGDRHGDGGE